jgi:hypothetical protein
MTKKEYNGWHNYETWCVNLWLGNDEGSYNYWRERAQEAWDNAEAERNFTRDERATLDLSDTLKSEIDDDAEDNGALPKLEGLYADLLNAALSEVNWHEIAEHMIEDVDKSSAEEVEAD